ncbi:MAG: alkaline phosphatase family protein [Planctomycetes bacterium]|nr:alkaline phosphatase family protein [Planctomycetota bacterium]
MKRLRLLALFLVFTSPALHAAEPTRSENAILVLVDGVRWQEIFGGIDASLLTKENGGIEDATEIRKAYARDDIDAQRAALMPFFWRVMAKDGQVFGNQKKGCVVHVANGKNFSYPGYSEMLVGFPDDRIDSNDKKPNPNVTVLEWLNGKPRWHGKVAAFGAWDVVPYIVNRERCGFFVNAGFEPLTEPMSPRVDILNQLKLDLPKQWEGEPADAITFYSMLEYVKAHTPRVLYLTFGETDEFAHSGRYADVLESIHRTDRFVETLWTTVQAMESYRGKTTLIVATDHGRGDGPREWKNHGKDTKGSENIWIAILGPDTPALGERANVGPFTQSQIEATFAAALGEDYHAAIPKAAPALDGAIAPPR